MANPTFNGRASVQRASIYDSMYPETTSSRVLLVHQLAGQGDVNSLRQQIDKDTDLIEAKDSDGTTPLFKAASQAHLECVQYLVTSGANLDVKDTIGRTPLAVAAYQGWRDGVYYLLAMEANCLLSDNSGRLPLHAAASCSSKETLEVLLQFIRNDAVDKQDNEGMTALHWASFHGHPDHIELLLSKGADVVTRDTEGKMPIHWAAQNGSVSCCQAMIYLADSHTLVNGKDYTGKTPIHLAAAAGSFQVLMKLATVDFANIQATDSESRTPLHWAAITGKSRCVALLLRLGADKELEDNHGAKALYYAQQGQHSACCEILLEHDPSDPLKTAIPLEEEGKPVIGSYFDKSFNGDQLDFYGFNLYSDINESLQQNFIPPRENRDTLRLDQDEVINLIPTLRTVEVRMDVNYEDGTDFESDLHASMNGMHGNGDVSYNSDDESRYPPQMVLTPVPHSPIPTEENSDDEGTRPSLLPRFSLGEQAAMDLKLPTPAPSYLAPLKSKTIPEHLKLNISHSSGTVVSVERKPSSPSSEASLGPLKLVKAKQSHTPPQVKSSMTTLRREETADHGDVSKQWTRKTKKSGDVEAETPRRTRERKWSSGNSGSQILPVIYKEKSSHVTQIQGTRQDQLEATKRIRRKPLKNRSISNEFVESAQMEEADEGFEDDARSLRSNEAAKDKKKKKKVKKVMSSNV